MSTLDALARESGTFAMVAIDQRESLRTMLAEHHAGPIEDDLLVRFKLAVVRELGPHASGLLIDDAYGVHVVEEAARLLPDSCGVLEAGDMAALGPLLSESHKSLRDDYEVSTPELDALVEALVDAGALGARLTGAGFGGCVVGLASRDEADRIVETAAGRYWAETGHQPRAFVFRAVDGAGRIPAQSA